MAGRSRSHEDRPLILVDSSVWIDYFRGVANRQTDKLGDLILTEVLQGLPTDEAFNRVARMLARLTVVELGGKDIAIQAARNFRALRQQGVTVRKTIDTIIATRCIESDFELQHNDRDFDPFARLLGLRVVL